jgi:hypothetical protein
LIYSLDRDHYQDLIKKKDPITGGNISPREIEERLHFDVIDPKTGYKIKEVDIQGRELTSGHKK